jgi:hypothetical protein
MSSAGPSPEESQQNTFLRTKYRQPKQASKQSRSIRQTSYNADRLLCILTPLYSCTYATRLLSDSTAYRPKCTVLPLSHFSAILERSTMPPLLIALLPYLLIRLLFMLLFRT